MSALKIRIIRLIIVLGLLLSFSIATAQNRTVVELKFGTFLDEGTAEQDVFVMGVEGLAFRVSPHALANSLDDPLCGLAHTAEFVYDPYMLSPNPVGPYDIGVPLDLTLEEWLAASGEGTYTVEEGQAAIDVKFTGLVPDGAYSLWCSTTTLTPDFDVTYQPCGAPNSSESVFTADEHGQLSIQMAFPEMPPSTETQVSALALVWHPFSQTYDADSVSFGTLMFRQLHAVLGV